MNTWKPEREASTQRAAAALNQSIQKYFAEQAPQEQAIRLEVTISEQQQEGDEPEAVSTLNFVLPDGTPLEGHYRISNVGGNMYEIEAAVQDHSHTFNISLPDAEAAADDTYSFPVCEFLLAEITQIAGEIHLREESKP